MVYPRAYGATANAGAAYAAGKGLSPCVRGYPLHRANRARLLGSIPVCTGLPLGVEVDNGDVWVYPRVYGATAEQSREASANLGLSPCVRGYR